MKGLKKILLLLLLCLVSVIGITACKNETSPDSTPTQSDSLTGDNSSSDKADDSSQDDPTHMHSYTVAVTVPTCTEQGFSTHTCSCGNSYVDTYVNALNHDFTNYVYNNNATCENDGTETAPCSRQGCNKTDTRTKANTALGHEFINFVSDNNATYEKDGTKTAKCEHSGCDEQKTVTDVGSMLIKSDITFKTLTVNGTSVYGKVSNTTTTFSFINEIAVSGTAKFVVSLDIYGLQQVVTKIIPLEIGDNTVYITETVDDEPINVYTVTVRRRPMHNVTFNTNGGTSVVAQTVEEDSVISAPQTLREGYTFGGWDYDFSNPITKNETITASWTANNNTPYKVKYYLQNLENDEYTLETTENKTGTTDTTATAEIKTFEHFTYNESISAVSGNIDGDGMRVLYVYYTRNTYTVTFNGDGGVLANGHNVQSVKYQGSAIAPTFQRSGYDFEKFDNIFTNIDGDLIVTAQWKAIFVLSETGTEIKGLTEYGKNNYTEPIIPEMIDGVKILSIGERSFEYSSISAITIPMSISSIGTSAFYDCAKLKNVYYTGTLENWLGINILSGYANPLNNHAVLYINNERLTKLNSSNIPKNVTTINANAFYGCSSLLNVDIPTHITEIGDGAFSECINLTNINIPSNVNKMGACYTNCGALQEIKFDMIDWQTALTTGFFGAGNNSDGIILTIGKNVEIIQSHAFYAANIKEVIFEEEGICQKIDEGAFRECDNLKSIQIPDSVTWIDDYVFSQSGLENIIIGSGVSYISTYAFSSCQNLKDISVSQTNDHYQAIDGNLYTKSSSGIRLMQYPIGKTSTVFTVSNEINLTMIGSEAFVDASNLSTIVIPATVIHISTNSFGKYTPFAGCVALVSFVVEENNPNYMSIDGNLYTKDGKTLVTYAAGKTATEFEVPNGVTNIGDYAFRNCDNLKNVTMPNSVTTIGDGAFYGCDSLTSITLPNSVTSIGEWAFAYCYNLNSIIIPTSVVSIGTHAFWGCDLTIYCEAEDKPSVWANDWYDSNYSSVVWGYNGE